MDVSVKEFNIEVTITEEDCSPDILLLNVEEAREGEDNDLTEGIKASLPEEYQNCVLDRSSIVLHEEDEKYAIVTATLLKNNSKKS